MEISHELLRPLLLKVEKPGRYVGGEYGAISHKPALDDYLIAVVFPDLYEIAMSNQAVRILYRMFNKTGGLHAERAFMPDLDFQQELKNHGLPIFSLENAIPLKEFDLLAISIGVELSFTNVLTLLGGSAIPLRSVHRNESDPLIIAGGPAITNPAPWMAFIDAVYIGEAEEKVAADMLELREMKHAGASRSDLLERLSRMEGYFTASNPRAQRVVWMGFSRQREAPSAFPIPSLIPVHSNGVVEIMRGCPRRCRFCHAGVFYRPFRMKDPKRILKEIDFLVKRCGYRSITLSSLSSGDYTGLEALLECLNKKYAATRVSFSLPSLRVNSITLSLLDQLGSVRKSALTFAVETPTREGQRAINKEVAEDRIVDILLKAKEMGWRLAKFYFMLGLPLDNADAEASNIIDYLLRIQRKTGMRLHVNLASFIPKPHTPFERSAQLSDAEAMATITRIRDGLKRGGKIRCSFQSPFASFIEGIIARGDERAGELAFDAWRFGAHFDAWDDRLNKNAWRKAIADADWQVERESCRKRREGERVPWEGVSLGPRAGHFKSEMQRSVRRRLTEPCAPECRDSCGVCNEKHFPTGQKSIRAVAVATETTQAPQYRRLFIFYSKTAPAVYLGHRDVMGIFEKALRRAGFRVDFTQGFNPKPRIEYAQPLPLGVSSVGEICAVKTLFSYEKPAIITERVNSALPPGFHVQRTAWIENAEKGSKTQSIMSAFWGSTWRIREVRKKTGSARKLKGDILSECREREILKDTEITHRQSDVIVTLKHSGESRYNFLKILKTLLGSSFSDWEISRLVCWAKDKRGEPRSYSEVFSQAP